MLILDFFGFFGEYHFFLKSKIFHCTYYVLLHLTISTRFWNVFRFSAMFNRQLYLVKVLLALLFLFLYYAFCVISMGILNLLKITRYFSKKKAWVYQITYISTHVVFSVFVVDSLRVALFPQHLVIVRIVHIPFVVVLDLNNNVNCHNNSY